MSYNRGNLHKGAMPSWINDHEEQSHALRIQYTIHVGARETVDLRSLTIISH
jgi:hypothetical protein